MNGLMPLCALLTLGTQKVCELRADVKHFLTNATGYFQIMGPLDDSVIHIG
jgi:hypothetical protein